MMRNPQLKHRLIRFGVAGLLRRVNRTPRVIFWHGVEQVKEDASLHISPAMFEDELNFLIRHYEVISIEEYESRFRTNQFTGKEVVLTFDDGYKNNLTIAAPILQRLGLPFTVFVSTRHIGDGEFFPTAIARMILLDSGLTHLNLKCIRFQASLRDRVQRQQVCKAIISTMKHAPVGLVHEICQQLTEHITPEEYQGLCAVHPADQPMNWEEVKQLHDDFGATIGSHCVDHFLCNIWQSEEEVERQVTESKQEIEDRIGGPCDYLAYPNGVYNAGDVTEYARKMVEKAGYKLAFTTVTDRLQTDSNPYLMPRCAARFEMDDFIMKLVLKPKLSFI